MHDGKRVAVVVPAYNEEAHISDTLRSIPEWVDGLIVVDDGSQDSTAQNCQAVERNVTVLRHQKNLGVGAAIVTGYKHAFDAGFDVAAVMGADGQMDPKDLTRVVAPVTSGRCDYCKGDRFSHAAGPSAIPIARRLGNQALSALTTWLTHRSIRDSQCGYTALARHAAKKLDLTSLWPGYGYPNDLLIRVAKKQLRLAQVPVRAVYGDEHSGLRWWHGALVIPWVTLRSWWTTSQRA